MIQVADLREYGRVPPCRSCGEPADLRIVASRSGPDQESPIRQVALCDGCAGHLLDALRDRLTDPARSRERQPAVVVDGASDRYRYRERRRE